MSIIVPNRTARQFTSPLFALTSDGKRKLIAIQGQGRKAEDFRAEAELLAGIADCTLREFEPGCKPSEAEIEEALRDGQTARLANRATPAAIEEGAGEAEAQTDDQEDPSEGRPSQP